MDDRIVDVPVYPVASLEDQEVGHKDTTHKKGFFSHKRPALERTVFLQKELLEGGGGVDRFEDERHESPYQVRIPEGGRENEAHQTSEQILVPIQESEILDGFHEFGSLLESRFKAFCEAAPIFEICGHLTAPELDEGSQAKNATERIFLRQGTHGSISLKWGLRATWGFLAS
jgi:hypothetical protein